MQRFAIFLIYKSLYALLMIDDCLEVALSKRGCVEEQPLLLKQMIEGGLDARIVKVGGP